MVSMRAYTHKRKKRVFCAPDGIQTLDLWISSPTTEPTRHPTLRLEMTGSTTTSVLRVIEKPHHILTKEKMILGLQVTDGTQVSRECHQQTTGIS